MRKKIKENNRKIAVAGLAVSILAAAAAIQIGTGNIKQPEKHRTRQHQ